MNIRSFISYLAFDVAVVVVGVVDDVFDVVVVLLLRAIERAKGESRKERLYCRS
jgi:hypothetical protein